MRPMCEATNLGAMRHGDADMDNEVKIRMKEVRAQWGMGTRCAIRGGPKGPRSALHHGAARLLHHVDDEGPAESSRGHTHTHTVVVRMSAMM